MVLSTRLLADKPSLDKIGCGSGREMADHEDTVRSSTTSTTSTSSPPLPSSSSSPSSRPHHNAPAALHSHQGERPDFHPPLARLQLSPMCNGYSSTSPRKTKEEGDVPNSDRCVRERGGGKACNGSPTNPPFLDRAAKDESQQHVPAMVKQERDQDGPLDFSVRRRDSVSESFTDDSRASSSISPSSYSGVGLGGPQAYSSSTSMQHSPEAELLHPAVQAVPAPPQRHSHHQRHHSGGSHGAESVDHFHKLPQLGRSPGSSPDQSELIGQPKTAPKMSAGSIGSRSPVNSSLAALGMMAEGGGGGITPAALAAMTGQNGGMMGSLGNLSTFMGGDAQKMMGANGSKVQRPFKAYPKEALQMPLGYLGLPGITPFPTLDFSSLQGVSLSQEEIVSMYKQQLDFLKEREKQMMTVNKMSNRSPPLSTTSSTSSSSSFGISTNGSSNSMVHPAPPPPPPLPPPAPFSQSSITHSHPALPTSITAAAAAAASSYFPPSSHSKAASLPPHHSSAGYSHIPISTPASSHFPTPTVPPLVSSTSSITGTGSRKRPRSLPDNQKDDAYWERRRKNNDAAKRSRDARRAKEDEIAIRAVLLEQENLKLRVEVAALKTETARLRCMLYNS